MTPSTDRCTRCGCDGLIRLRGTLEWKIPYRLCPNCAGVQATLPADSEASARFARDVWRRAVSEYLESVRTG